MLAPEDQRECISHLPPFDISQYDHLPDDWNAEPRLAAGLFENNASLQEDLRVFQVEHDAVFDVLIFSRMT